MSAGKKSQTGWVSTREARISAELPGDSLALLHEFPQVDDSRIRAGQIICHDERVIREQSVAAAIENDR